MARSQRNDNFVDKTFTVIADLILQLLPTNADAKQAFAYYRDGMAAQGDGEYAEALDNYREALKLEQDPYDRSFVFYNIGLIHASNGEHEEALEHYHQALELNPRLPQALNNVAVIYHYQGEKAQEALERRELLEKQITREIAQQEALQSQLKSESDLQGRTQLETDLAAVQERLEARQSEFAPLADLDVGAPENNFDKAAEYWKQAIRLAPNNYIEAQNWLKTTGRAKMDVFF